MDANTKEVLLALITLAGNIVAFVLWIVLYAKGRAVKPPRKDGTGAKRTTDTDSTPGEESKLFELAKPLGKRRWPGYPVD